MVGGKPVRKPALSGCRPYPRRYALWRTGKGAPSPCDVFRRGPAEQGLGIVVTKLATLFGRGCGAIHTKILARSPKDQNL
jgi:hypothetical protein